MFNNSIRMRGYKQEEKHNKQCRSKEIAFIFLLVNHTTNVDNLNALSLFRKDYYQIN